MERLCNDPGSSRPLPQVAAMLMKTRPVKTKTTAKRDARKVPLLREWLLDAQFDLVKSQAGAVVVIITGVPTAGRSEVANKILEWLDPKHVAVHALPEPDAATLGRPPLWRHWQVLPARGKITLCFGGWYDGYIPSARFKLGKPPVADRRMVRRVLKLETMLRKDRVHVLKIHLHVDKNTQNQRHEKLLADKLTRWRVTRDERWLAKHHDAVAAVIDRTLKSTAHEVAPWYMVDGSDPEQRADMVGTLLLEQMQQASREAAPAVGKPVDKSKGTRAQVHLHKPAKARDYDRELAAQQSRLALLTRRKRFAKRSLVLAFEGMDAAGKGGAIRRVARALDARQYEIIPTSAPTAEERLYPYLRRFWRHIPARGHIAIFDRSWYGRVLVERVRGFTAAEDWHRAYDEIVEFERELTEHDIIVQKFWLSVSPSEQLERFKRRDANRLKRFKVDPEDWVNRDFWDAYQTAAAEMIRRTQTPDAPWLAIDADDKAAARVAILDAICTRIERALD
jgi:polyphosphate:AMP phosphotransferase